VHLVINFFHLIDLKACIGELMRDVHTRCSIHQHVVLRQVSVSVKSLTFEQEFSACNQPVFPVYGSNYLPKFNRP
jgi:hypothetical protein